LFFYYDGKLILKLISKEKLLNAYKCLIFGGIYLKKKAGMDRPRGFTGT
jgi:hypothetical protein